MLKRTAEQRRGVKNRNELNWNLTGTVSYVHVAQPLSQSVKAVLVFLIYNCITVKLRKPITIITVLKVQDMQANLKTTIVVLPLLFAV